MFSPGPSSFASATRSFTSHAQLAESEQHGLMPSRSSLIICSGAPGAPAAHIGEADQPAPMGNARPLS